MITRIPVTLTLVAPYATRSNSVGGFGTDLPLARDAQDRLMLPGSHVIGKMAQATRELVALLQGDPAEAGFIDDLKWLHAAESNSKTTESADGREGRRNLTASDFVLQSPPETKGTRTRIARDNVTGTVAEGMLQVIEQPFPPGQPLRFEGELRLFGSVGTDRLTRLHRVLQLVSQFGGLRTVGFGVVSGVTFGLVAPKGAAASVAAAEDLILRLSFADPFCAGEARNTPNTYVSAGFVPGGVVKGAIARQVLAAHGLTGFLDDPAVQAKLPARFHDLAKAFGDIRIGHAAPVLKGHARRRPLSLPDSLAVIEEGDKVTVMDLSGLDNPASPVLVNGQVPLGRSDWKDNHHEAARSVFALPELPGRELRIRTQIDESRRAAMTNRLFGIEYTRIDRHDFIAPIHVPAGANAAAIKAALAEIVVGGIAGIGRGGAYAATTLGPALSEGSALTGETRVVLVLQSAALLRDPGQAGVALQQAYQTAFSAIGLPATWRLNAVFARERLAGAGFFLNRLAQSAAYRPWLLTDPGATFVFDQTAPGVDFPWGWLETGLPVPDAVLQFHDIARSPAIYRVCPYLPQNGYGEVIAGFPASQGAFAHQSLKPNAHGMTVEPVDLISLVAAP